MVLAATGADLVILNSGTFRSDRIHLPGPFTMRDLMSVVPLTDPIVVLEVTGKNLYLLFTKSNENSTTFSNILKVLARSFFFIFKVNG